MLILFLYTSAIYGESDQTVSRPRSYLVRRAHASSTRDSARFGKSRTKTLVEVGSRRLVVEREWYNIRPSEDSELEGCSVAKGTTGNEDSAREKYR